MNTRTGFPIIAIFLLVLLIMFACALFRRRGRSGQNKAEHEEPASKPVASAEPVVMHDCAVLPDQEPPEFRIKELEKEVAELKQEIARIKYDKRDMKKNLKLYRETAEIVRKARNKLLKVKAGKDETRPGKNRRTGKKPGSAGGGFACPGRIDRIKHWRLKTCSKCGASVAGCNPVSSWSHVIIDVERPRNKRGMLWVTTKHVLYRYRCPSCGKIVAKDFGMYKHLHYGLGIIAFALQQRVEHRESWDGVQATAIQVFGEEHVPTIQAFIDWVKDLGDVARIVHARFKEEIKRSRRVNCDETGLPMDGDHRWLWILVTAHVVLFLPSESRGHETIAGIFDGYKGILVSDFWSAYNMLGVEQQKCLAHVVVELQEIEHVASEAAARDRQALAKDAEQQAAGGEDKAANTSLESTAAKADAPAKVKRKGRPPKPVTPLSSEERAKIEARIEESNKAFAQAQALRHFFDEAWGDGPMGCKAPVEQRLPVDEAVKRMQVLVDKIRQDGPANEAIRRLLDRFEKHGRSLFTYLAHGDVPPDNNAAERPLRHFVAQRKASGNFVSPAVMDVHAVLLSLAKTCKLNGVAFEAVLRPLLKGDVNAVFDQLGLPPPTPSPARPGRQDKPPGTRA
ncbi:MAG: transposase [Candidatus Sigynarchaeota archaeon]